MHWETKKFMWLTLLQWFGTKPTLSPVYASISCLVTKSQVNEWRKEGRKTASLFFIIYLSFPLSLLPQSLFCQNSQPPCTNVFIVQISSTFWKFTLCHFAFTKDLCYYLFLLTKRNLKNFAFTKKERSKNSGVFVMYTLSSESSTAKLLPWEPPYTRHLSIKPP